MSRRVGFLLGAGVTLSAGSSLAQPGTACEQPMFRIEGALAARWLEPVVDLCEALPSMHDVDPSAHLRVVAAGDDVIVEVTLRDGRSTLRRVRATSDLPLTVEALVAVPPATPTTPAEPIDVVAPPPVSEPFPIPVQRRFNFEVGANAKLRIEGAPRYVSVGLDVYAGVRAGAWLLALQARYDGYETVTDDRPRDFEMTTVGGGFALLRELAATERGSFEAGLTTWLLGETQSYTPQTVELAFSSFDVRLGAFTRWIFGPRPLRAFVSLDAELSPTHIRHQVRVEENLPTLPTWSIGFGAGVAWEPQ